MDGALTGSLIDGRYRVGAIVGAGGFGTVYAAVHVGLVGQVALKIPRVDDLAPQDASRLIATFLEEGRLLKRLRHPNIVTALDVGLLPADDAGRSLPYLVLEWCDGVTLKDWLSDRGPLSRDAAWALLRPAFEAIGHAHEHGIAHRDVKPSNILLEKQRGTLVPRVIDFGIAKVVEPKTPDASGATRTTSDRPAYTPKYAAPEQLLGLRSGPPSDVFALALVLLETVLGRSVFVTNEAARAAIADGDLPTPQKLGLDLGPWNDVLERALAWRAADRWPDAQALVRALDGDESSPPPSRPPPSSRAQSSRSPSVAPSRAEAAPSRDEAASVTARTTPRGNMAHALVEIGDRRVFLALHTKQAPSEAEWRDWTETLEERSKAAQWQLADMPNLVLTDGGAPNTAQRTTVNVLIAQARSLPPVALVTSSGIVRVMVRAFSIFNPRIRVFAPADIAAAVAHLGLDRAHVPEILARCARLEADVLGAGAVETLGAVTKIRA